MSDEMRELTRVWVDAFNARRVPTEILADDFVMVNATTAVTEQTYSGVAGVERWFDDLLGVFADGWRYSIDLVAFGESCTVGRVNLTGHGRVSGSPLDMSHWGVVWVERGKVARAVGYTRKREALEAAGL